MEIIVCIYKLSTFVCIVKFPEFSDGCVFVLKISATVWILYSTHYCMLAMRVSIWLCYVYRTTEKPSVHSFFMVNIYLCPPLPSFTSPLFSGPLKCYTCGHACSIACILCWVSILCSGAFSCMVEWSALATCQQALLVLKSFVVKIHQSRTTDSAQSDKCCKQRRRT